MSERTLGERFIDMFRRAEERDPEARPFGYSPESQQGQNLNATSDVLSGRRRPRETETLSAPSAVPADILIPRGNGLERAQVYNTGSGGILVHEDGAQERISRERLTELLELTSHAQSQSTIDYRNNRWQTPEERNQSYQRGVKESGADSYPDVYERSRSGPQPGRPISPGSFKQDAVDARADNLPRSTEAATTSYRDHVNESGEYQLPEGARHDVEPGQYHTAVANLQEYLHMNGHDPGEIDGRWGPRTAAAYNALWEQRTGNNGGATGSSPPRSTNIPYIMNRQSKGNHRR